MKHWKIFSKNLPSTFHFIYCPHNVLDSIWVFPPLEVAVHVPVFKFFSLFHLEQFLSLCLSFMTMIFLRNTDFLREWFYFGFGVFSWLCSGYGFLIKMLHKWHIHLRVSHLKVYDIYMTLCGDINFDNLAMMCIFSTLRVRISLETAAGGLNPDPFWWREVGDYPLISSQKRKASVRIIQQSSDVIF